MAAPSEERRDESGKEMVHKTKAIQFLGRTTPIILQNDNGPCPLLAICSTNLSGLKLNWVALLQELLLEAILQEPLPRLLATSHSHVAGNVLLLKNNLSLSPDITEVSQEKLLSLVAERLLDSNSNVNSKDAEYAQNQQQNIADAIDLLPRLATGIDVNIKFLRIHDFEFTPECAIFDLLDIPLCHGWIVDSQDYDTVNAIGSKSYNTLMGELVALETNLEGEQKKNSEEDVIDFAAATTATLRVPSPCLSRGRSFDDSSHAVSHHDTERKGDIEEEEELFRVLKLSRTELPIDVQNVPLSSNESAYLEKSEPEVLENTLKADRDSKFLQDFSSSHNFSALSNCSNGLIAHEAVTEKATCLKTDNHTDPSTSEETGNFVKRKDVLDACSYDMLVQNEISLSDSFARDPLSACGNRKHESRTREYAVEKQLTSSSDLHEPENNKHGGDMTEISKPGAYLDSSSARRQDIDVPDPFTSSADGSEPIYEGEDCILESGSSLFEEREPIYEGEVVLAEQVDKSAGDGGDASSKDKISPRHGELIRNFLKNNASQLTIYGLFSLQDGLKERELCVFFRNNHFSTMFKFDGELYILATDQGYLNQPDLVWEKLNEVNGDTLFMTGDFKEFKVECHANTWDPQNAMASTADYLASIDNSANKNSSFNSDLQLAIALQQQEFDQQPPRNVQQPSVTGSSMLVTGPQGPSSRGRGSSLPSRQEPKSTREKCIVM